MVSNQSKNEGAPLMARELANAVGASKRQIQIWTDAGAIQCRSETDRLGRGKQRLYDAEELLYAAVSARLAELQLPIGRLKGFTEAMRTWEAVERSVPWKSIRWTDWNLRPPKMKSLWAIFSETDTQAVRWATSRKELMDTLEGDPSASILFFGNSAWVILDIRRTLMQIQLQLA